MMVSWRRSGSADAGLDSEADGGGLPDIATLGAPQSTQNRFLGTLLTPQAWQIQGSGSPQSPQNFWLLATRV
jgi:hypothetical protein